MNRRTLLRRLFAVPIVAAVSPLLPRPDFAKLFAGVAEEAERMSAGMLTLNIKLRDDFSPRLRALSIAHRETIRAAMHAEGERIMLQSKLMRPVTLPPRSLDYLYRDGKVRPPLMTKADARRRADQLLDQYAHRRPEYAIAVHEPAGRP